ncbi:MAG: SDR family oxidoreductase [Verrucomicrobiales bacterium]|nr:SDR family oxidoreductase [Verrucomicrobiales bacterium]
MSQAEPRLVLVTGASRGIGRFLAELQLKQGHKVVGCSRNESDLRHSSYEHVVTDVTNEDQVTRLLKHVRRVYGRLNVLINNAGVAAMNPVLLTPKSSAESVVQTSLLGSFLVCREAAKVMLNGTDGRMVNFTSVAVPMRLEGEAIYAAAKSAVETFTKVFAREVAPYGITVNAVGPSPIETDLIRGVSKQKLDSLVERLAIKRLGTFADVANVVDFFLRPESNYITGQVIYLGGQG